MRRPLFTVVKTEPFLSPRSGVIVMIDAKGPRGAIYHFTVTVSRKGEMQSCVRTDPQPRFLKREAIPHVIANAAELAALELIR